MEMATHGSLSAFDPSKEDWTSYTDRMKHYFIANDVTDGDKKRSILLSACGASTFNSEPRGERQSEHYFVRRHRRKIEDPL